MRFFQCVFSTARFERNQKLHIKSTTTMVANYAPTQGMLYRVNAKIGIILALLCATFGYCLDGGGVEGWGRLGMRSDQGQEQGR
jgi:hypothetical protein